MNVGSVTNLTSGFVPLMPLLRTIPFEKLDEARRRVAKLGHDELIQKYRNVFSDIRRESGASRVLSLVLSDELTRRKIAPWIRHHHLSTVNYGVNQAFDLFIQDVRYLRHTYPHHAWAVKHRRCKALFSGSESNFHAEADFCFYEGTRAAWKIVRTLSLSEEQQLCCMWLRSVPIAKKLAATEAMRERIFRLLQADLASTRRTRTFTNNDAHAALMRRHRLWVCREHTNGRIADIANAYEALTGQAISRQIASRQLQLVDQAIKKER